MRVKTETKRQEIIAVARKVFEDEGFEGASMNTIIAKLGGSKATIYNYFPSKEELFIEVMLESIQHHGTNLLHSNKEGDIREILKAFADRFIEVTTTPWVMNMYKTVLGFKGNDAVLHSFYERGSLRGEDWTAEVMQVAINNGQLQLANPRLMAKQFRSLIEAPYMLQMMFNKLDPPSSRQKKLWAEEAVKAFLKIYGT